MTEATNGFDNTQDLCTSMTNSICIWHRRRATYQMTNTPHTQQQQKTEIYVQLAIVSWARFTYLLNMMTNQVTRDSYNTFLQNNELCHIIQ